MKETVHYYDKNGVEISEAGYYQLQLRAVERERDELRAEQAEHDEQIARMESKFSLAKRALDSKTARCEKAEAELRRRDAAAGEPVGYIDPESMRKYRGVMAGGTWSPNPRGGEYNQTLPIYTASQPALLPPEMTIDRMDCELTDFGKAISCAAYNQCREDAMALGAQQQKVVELPEPVKWPEIPFKYFSEEQVFSMLDAAGVKWEVTGERTYRANQCEI